jgi:hypothetical protein
MHRGQKNAYMILVGKYDGNLKLGEYIAWGFSKNRTGVD